MVVHCSLSLTHLYEILITENTVVTLLKKQTNKHIARSLLTVAAQTGNGLRQGIDATIPATENALGAF